MGSIDGVNNSYLTSFTTKAASMETTLNHAVQTFKELMLDFEQIKSELQIYQTEISAYREKCESQLCTGSEAFKKTVESKDHIIQCAVSTAITIDETKNVDLISKLLRILCGEVEVHTKTVSKLSLQNKESLLSKVLYTPKKEQLHTETKSNSPGPKKKKLSPKQEKNTPLEESVKDESVSEIEGTPGRTSPIFQSRIKSSSSASLSGSSTSSRDKKKCPPEWSSPEPKQLKLSFPSPKTADKMKWRQTRISLLATKRSNTVDLTCSPELSGDSRTGQNMDKSSQNPFVQLLIKKESSDNEDTIFPSPTSGPTNIVLSKSTTKDNQKCNRKLSLGKSKVNEKEIIETEEINSPIIQVVEKKAKTNHKEGALELLDDSVNILKPNRFPKSPNKLTIIKSENSPAKFKSPMKENAQIKPAKPELPVKLEPIRMEEDVTHCEESSMSILHQNDDKFGQMQKSPNKKPLRENKNLVNIPNDQESMSILPHEPANDNAPVDVSDSNKKRIPEKVEPIYKEPTVRKKAEKLALPAWCCEECKKFFADLYGDDAEKIAAVVARCSKHRGRNNPARPLTPPGFWYPRWEVPHDTEEFNRRNNAQ